MAAPDERIAELERALARAERTKQVLMDRVERGSGAQVSAFGLFERNLLLQQAVAARTAQLEAANAALQQQNALLEAAHARVRKLEGIIPICMYCHQIREEEGPWKRLEAYLSEHSDALLSHGICPKCFDERFAELGDPPVRP